MGSSCPRRREPGDSSRAGRLLGGASSRRLVGRAAVVASDRRAPMSTGLRDRPTDRSLLCVRSCAPARELSFTVLILYTVCNVLRSVRSRRRAASAATERQLSYCAPPRAHTCPASSIICCALGMAIMLNIASLTVPSGGASALAISSLPSSRARSTSSATTRLNEPSRLCLG